MVEDGGQRQRRHPSREAGPTVPRHMVANRQQLEVPEAYGLGTVQVEQKEVYRISGNP